MDAISTRVGFDQRRPDRLYPGRRCVSRGGNPGNGSYEVVTPEERRLARLSKALEQAVQKLQSTRREDYKREVDYRRVLTMRRNKVVGLRKMKGD
jgi:hypothetical protein